VEAWEALEAERAALPELKPAGPEPDR